MASYSVAGYREQGKCKEVLVGILEVCVRWTAGRAARVAGETQHGYGCRGQKLDRE